MMTFDRLRQYTKARIGLGHVGPALPTKAWLNFAFAHAQAVDAVDIKWDITKQNHELSRQGISSSILKTKIHDRTEYLMRPDLGCLLDDQSKKNLADLGECPDSIMLVASNGLSSSAIINHLTNFLPLVISTLKNAGFRLAHDRVLLIPNGRVGLIDDVGDIIRPTIGVILIGERPGLSSPDSMAAYLTYQPHQGRVNAERNCISNIRPPDGLGYEEAARRLCLLIKESLRKKISGVALNSTTSLDTY
jgi:ethanolamine ammonia-lyase small subunit